MAAPYILARNLKEAHAFAREQLGLRQGHYRIVNHASTIKSVRGADLYLVPGWENRYDRFATKGAMRWTRMNVIDVAKQAVNREDPRGPLTDDLLDLAYAEDIVRSGGDTTALGFKSESDGLTPPGEQMTLVDATDFVVPAEPRDRAEVMQELEATLEPEGWEPPETLDADQVLRLAAGETGAEVAPTPEPKPANRRRSRCKDCGTLHFKGDPCPDGDS